MKLTAATCLAVLLAGAPALAQGTWWQPTTGDTAVPVTWACAAFADRERSRVYMTDLFEVTLMLDVRADPGGAEYDRQNAAYLFTRKASDAFASDLWASGVRSTDASCSAVTRQQHMKRFEAWSNADLVRVAFRGPDKAIAPDLINDLAARARYAALWSKAEGVSPPAKPKPPASPLLTPGPPAAALTVKDDTSLRDAGKAWEEQVRKSLIAEAQKRIETAARQAQADAKQKAELEAFFAQRRRQGRAQ